MIVDMNVRVKVSGLIKEDLNTQAVALAIKQRLNADSVDIIEITTTDEEGDETDERSEETEGSA